MSLRGIFDGGGLRKQNGHWQSSRPIEPQGEELFSIGYQETTRVGNRYAHNGVSEWIQDTGNSPVKHIRLLPGHRYRVTIEYYVRCNGQEGYTGNWISATSAFTFGNSASIVNGDGVELNGYLGSEASLVVYPVILSKTGQTARITNISNYGRYSSDPYDTTGTKDFGATFSYDIIPDTVFDCDYNVYMATADFLQVDATGSIWGGTVSATLGYGVAITRVS